MDDVDLPGLGTDDLRKISAVWNCRTADLKSLMEAGNLDPSTDFRNGDFRGWNFSLQDVRGIDFTGSDLRGTGIESAIFDSSTVLAGATLDGGLAPLTPGATNLHPVQTPKQARRLALKLLNDADRDFSAGERERAHEIAISAQELINLFLEQDFPIMAPSAFRATIAVETYLRPFVAAPDLETPLSLILKRLSSLVAHDDEAVQALLDISKHTVSSPIAIKCASLVSGTLFEASESIVAHYPKSEDPRTFALMEGRVFLETEIRQLDLAETEARNLIRMADAIQASVHTSPDYVLRATFSLGRVLLAKERKTIETISMMTRALDEAAGRLSSESSLASINDFLHAVNFFYQVAEPTVLERRRHLYIADLISGVEKTLTRYRPIFERREIIKLLSVFGKSAARLHDDEMSHSVAKLSFKLNYGALARDNSVITLRRLAASMLDYAMSLQTGEVEEIALDEFQVSIEALRDSYRTSRTSRTKYNLTRGLQALEILARLAGQEKVARGSRDEITRLESEKPSKRIKI